MEKLKAGQMIEWHDLDKRKFYVIGPSCFILVRGFLYPFNLIKTRLFMQQKASHYSGTFDAFRKVVRHEGFRGLYKGFMVSSFGMLSGQLYITTYEVVRSRMNSYPSEMKGLVAGACATLVGQTVTVPIDVVSQIMMMQGQSVSSQAPPPHREHYILVKNVDYVIPRRDTGKLKLKGAVSIVRDIVGQKGVQGLYRGYLVSLLTYAPNSALWWAAYTGFYQRVVLSEVLDKLPLPVLQALCGMAGGLLAAVLTNPLDVFRTRYQVRIGMEDGWNRNG